MKRFFSVFLAVFMLLDAVPLALAAVAKRDIPIITIPGTSNTHILNAEGETVVPDSFDLKAFLKDDAAMRPLLSRGARFCLRYPRLFSYAVLLRLRRTAMGRAITQTQLSLWRQSGDALMREVPTLHYSASVLPGDETQRLLRRVQRAIARTPIRLSVSVLEEPGNLSPAQGLSWDALCTAIQVHFPGMRVVPCLLAGGTDSRRMEGLCPCVYRFSPFILPPEELARTHNYDERLSVENLRRGVSFFRQMLQA